MKQITIFSLFLSLALFAAPKAPPEYLKVTKIKNASVLVNGKAGEAVVTCTVAIGMHVQSNPAAQPNLVATQLNFEPNEEFEVGTLVFPEAKPYRLQNSDKDITTFDGTFDIKVPVKATAKAKLGKQELKAKLRYQACNDKICFFPSTIPVVLPVMVYK